MRPRKLTMQAFGSYGKKTEIDFRVPNQNLFLITGDTGAGKTTIFDAIVFALYGEASSESNRKNGLELQSQFADQGEAPFVELEFSEGDEIYTVRRAPRHLRPLKRGKGEKEEVEAVSLLMPDGREYGQNKKETDAKLTEIIGLTKSQFMQVAMIAQGEFMELLRAGSDQKKAIFRRLFGTGLYETVVQELARRTKEKSGALSQLFAVCKNEIGRLELPALADLKTRIMEADTLSVTDLEELLTGLEAYCKGLKGQQVLAEEKSQEAGRLRDEARDAVQKARSLQEAFGQLEEAEERLALCREQQEEIQKEASLMGQIEGAYEIKAVYDRYQEGARRARETEEALKAWQEELPELAEAWEMQEKEAQQARTAQEKALQEYTRVFEGVKAARELFGKLQKAQEELKKQEVAACRAEQVVEAARTALQDFTEQEQQWKQQAEALKNTEVALLQWKSRAAQAEQTATAAGEVEQAQQRIADQGQKLQKAQKQYEAARAAYQLKNEEYAAKQRAFLDAQAGLLAREKLRPGEPCPVCGSLSHPAPCRLTEAEEHLTREMIDELEAEVRELNENQKLCAAKAASAAEVLKEKEQQHEAAKERLGQLLEEAGLWKEILEVNSKSFSLSRIQERIEAWQAELAREGQKLQEDVGVLQTVRENLNRAEGKRAQLQQQLEAAAEQQSEGKKALAAAGAALEALEAQKTYDTLPEAEAALRAAEQEKKKAGDAWEKAKQAAEQAKKKKEAAETLMGQYQRELPKLQEERAEQKKDYEACLQEKELKEEEWKELSARYRKETVAELREKAAAYHEKKNQAEGQKAAALKTIGGQPKPELQALEERQLAADAAYRAAAEEANQVKELLQRNQSVYTALGSRMAERSQLMAEYTRMDSLYRRLSGKVTGGRMDIETFVQRYYLQRILYAANDHFREMSGGQFELRMVEEAQAGAGRNRGLDLMVYSVITGKEREVRTLSGGESFMAALSLALGMADQIRENTASIHLDIMFIDEGFGSLDDHARNQAVRVLQRLSGGDKLIAIISHVSELKQEIEDQLLVGKDEDGSHVRWVIS